MKQIVIWEDIPRILCWADKGTTSEPTRLVTDSQYQALQEQDMDFAHIQAMLQNLLDN